MQRSRLRYPSRIIAIVAAADHLRTAEEFAKDDPFVLNNVVRAWHIREWNEVLTES